MIRRLLGTTVTTLIVVAVLGMLAWFAYAKVADATLITFRTGSMSPTMPQGALAVTLPVQADELAIGDVITVQRAGERMPVTHRVVEIGPVDSRSENAADIRATAPGSGPPDLASEAARQVVMQGDDNDSPDTLPYALTEARRVVFSVPGAGSALMMLQSPIGAGVLTLLAGALAVWAFWPRREAEEADPDDEAAGSAGRGEDAVGDEPRPERNGSAPPAAAVRSGESGRTMERAG